MDQNNSNVSIFGENPLSNSSPNIVPNASNNSLSQDNSLGNLSPNPVPVVGNTSNLESNVTTDANVATNSNNAIEETNTANNQIIPVTNVIPGADVVTATAENTNNNSISSEGIVPITNEIPNNNNNNNMIQDNSNSILAFDLPGSNTSTLDSTSPSNDTNVQNNSGIVQVEGEQSTIDTSVNNQSFVSNNTTGFSDVVSVGKYLGYFFLFAIPVIGFIMLVVKAFDKKDKNISNFAKAQLLFGVIVGAVAIVLSIIFIAMFGNSMNGIG